VVVSTTNKQAYQLSQLQQQQASPPAPPVPEKAVSIAPRSIPSSPSLDTLHTAKTSQHAFGTPTIPTSPSLNTIMSAAGPASSPNSPSMAGGAAVRRKPVPRREGDESQELCYAIFLALFGASSSTNDVMLRTDCDVGSDSSPSLLGHAISPQQSGFVELYSH
jgi:hypothetical protein